MEQKAIDILYVEDDELDVQLAKTALDYVSKPGAFRIHVVDDGEKALQFLHRAEPYQDVISPDMILLDLNLPKLHGRDVLRSIKDTEKFKKIPVIVLTTSQLQEDVDESYSLGASGYLTKPNELNDYRQKFKAISDFWFNSVNLPSKV
jgi:CheY-like chemotaxis protein